MSVGGDEFRVLIFCHVGYLPLSIYSCVSNNRILPFLFSPAPDAINNTFFEKAHCWLDCCWSWSIFHEYSNFILFFKNYLFYFTTLYWFCHTLTWICHGCTCAPHPEPPSQLPPYPIPLGHPSAPALSILYHALNLDWQFISHMINYMFHIW